MSSSPRAALRDTDHMDEFVPEQGRRVRALVRALVTTLALLTSPALLWLSPLTRSRRLELYVGMLFLFVLVIVFNARRREIVERWRWIAVGCSAFALSEAGRVVAISHETSAIALASEVVRIVGYVTLVVGVLVLIRRRGAAADRPSMIDASIVGCALLTLLWPLMLYPSGIERASGAVASWYAIARPLAAIAVCAVSVRLAVRRDRAYRTLCVGLVVLAAGDITGDVGVGGPATYGRAAEAAAVFAFGLVALAVHHGTRGESRHIDVGAADRMRVLCLLALVAPCFVSPLAFAWLSGDRNLSTLVSCIFAFLLFDLVALRLWHLASDARAAALRHGLRRLGALVQGLNDAIFVVDGSGMISYASPRAGALLGANPDRLLRRRFHECVAPADAARILDQLRHVARLPLGAGAELIGRYIDAEGAERDFELSLANRLDDWDVAGIVVTMRDVTARRELTNELERRAFRDDLTKLANRSLFMDRLEQAALRSRRAGTGFAVMFIDLDDFKAVNDGLGHAAGDALLRAVAERLRECMRAGDTIARLGGDEFAVLTESVLNDEVTHAAERLLQVLQLPVDVGEMSVTVPASIGIAFSEPGRPQSNLMRDADIALYRAKELGKNRYALFDPSMAWDAYSRLHLRAQLETAMDDDQLRVLFQPIVSLRTNEMVGVEALVRWEHPTLGTLLPDEFITAAEESGIIGSIGRWVLRESCLQAVNFAIDAHELYVSVNVSARQLREPQFATEIADALARSGLAPERLMLELTESTLVDEVAGRNLVEHIVPLGVRIAIDDFGTGYSSLAYLQRFPVDVVKIDRSFVARLDEQGMRAVAKSMSAISSVMGYVTIAEGVETIEQAADVRSLDYEFAQGFLYSRPVEASRIVAMLQDAPVVLVD